MANQEQLAILKEGVIAWNEWRKKNPDATIDLRGANLGGAELNAADLSKADLFEADLSRANLFEANLFRADLRGADLSDADLSEATLSGADLKEATLSGATLSGADLSEASLVIAKLSGADLSRADLIGTNLSWAIFRGAILSGANLSEANLIKTNFERADLTDCRIYGISAWDVKLEGAIQKNLIITERGDPTLTVDDLEVAQFIYLLLNNKKIKDVIDTITSKAVLILGRFTEERKKVLDSIREELRQRGYVPIMYDFKSSASRDLTETIQLLANMAKFVIADITDANSIPQELSHIIPLLPSVPVQPILLASQREYGMFEHWRGFNSVLPEYLYEDETNLIENLEAKVILPADAWRRRQDKVATLEEENKALKDELAKYKRG